MKKSKLNSDKILKVWRKSTFVNWKVKRYGKYGGKVSWKVKRYGKYGKVDWIVKK
jgi:hypothetical protein